MYKKCKMFDTLDEEITAIGEIILKSNAAIVMPTDLRMQQDLDEIVDAVLKKYPSVCEVERRLFDAGWAVTLGLKGIHDQSAVNGILAGASNVPAPITKPMKSERKPRPKHKKKWGR